MLNPDSALLTKMPHTFNANDTLNSVQPDEPKNPINVSSFLRDDFMCKRRKFSIVIDAYKLADSDNVIVRDLNAKSA